MSGQSRAQEAAGLADRLDQTVTARHEEEHVGFHVPDRSPRGPRRRSSLPPGRSRPPARRICSGEPATIGGSESSDDAERPMAGCLRLLDLLLDATQPAASGPRAMARRSVSSSPRPS
jgi:hypothetical protein